MSCFYEIAKKSFLVFFGTIVFMCPNFAQETACSDALDNDGDGFIDAMILIALPAIMIANTLYQVRVQEILP